MIYFLALIPATALTIGGYFVLYFSARAEGPLRAFGKYLGFWSFTLAGLVILGAIFAAAHHGRRVMIFARPGMHGQMRGPWPGGPGFFPPRMMGERRYGARGAMPPPPALRPPDAAPGASTSSSSAPAAP